MPAAPPTCSAFVGHRRVAQGTYAQVAQVLSRIDAPGDTVLILDDVTSALLDVPSPTGSTAFAERAAASPAALDAPAAPAAPDADAASAPAAPSVGRPRLGVVAREVTLLPRHWEWLATQPGGASAALRRLVDEARRTHASRDAQRLAKDRTFRFLNAVAGNLAGFEEAARLLFADDARAFEQHLKTWPQDVREHAARLAQEAFNG